MITACLALLAASLCQPAPPPEVWAARERVGCTASLVPDPDSQHARWHVRVWVVYDAGKRWQALYSMRDGTERRRALTDCDDWLECVRKEPEPKQKPESR